MAHPNAEVLRRIDEAQTRGDFEAFFDNFTDDIKGHVMGHNSLAGDFEGKEKFQEVFGRFMAAVGDYSFENHAYLADDEHGIILQTSKAQRGGETLQLQEVFICHFRGGKVSEMWYVPLDQAALDAWVG